MKTEQTALIAGSTGLVGNALLQRLANDDYYSKIIVVVRKKNSFNHPKVVELVIDFDNLVEELKEVKADHVYCCLGTTLKTAGSKEAFYKVDFTYPLNLANIMHLNGANKFLIVTAIGANKKSIFFYNRVKGEIEEALKSLAYSSLVIFRPSLLLGKRKEYRQAEEKAKSAYKVLDRLMIGSLKKYKGIEGETVAHAMEIMGKEENSGAITIESNEIREVLTTSSQSPEK